MTIEERAKAFANERWPKEKFKSNDRYRREHYQKSRDTYIQIATEQKSIDIDKACEVYETELRQMKRILNEIQDGAGEIISIGGSLTEFRKALED